MIAEIDDSLQSELRFDVFSGIGGCVMANRLSEKLEWKVLLLEVGEEERDFLTDVPLTAAVTVLTSMFSIFFFFTKSSNSFNYFID